MNTGRHLVRVGDRWVEVPVAAMGDESLVVPVVAALVFPDELQGRWEIPMGRWRAGESAVEALTREVEEETGLRVIEVDAPAIRHEAAPGRPFLALRPLTVTIGVEGAYPALHLCFACVAEGEPRALEGETADPQWVAIADLEGMLVAAETFTGPALAILTTWLAAR